MVASKAAAKLTRKRRSAVSNARKEALAKARAAKQNSKPTSSASPPPPSSSSQSPAQTPLQQTVDPPGGIQVKESASKRKLRLTDDTSGTSFVNPHQLPIAIVDLSMLASLFSSFSCHACGGCLQLSCGDRRGFCYNLTVVCNDCAAVVSSGQTSKSVVDSRHRDINRRMVLSFLNLGQGYASMSSFCEVMGLECMTQATHSQHVTAIHNAASKLKDTTMSEAVKQVKLAHGKGDEDIVDIAVSYDGTWQKRGHTSKHGLGVVIAVTTGLVVDYHVLI